MGMLIFFAILTVTVILNVVPPGGEGALATREATWLLTLAALAAMLVLAGRAVGARWDGIFIDRENRISVARFQLILWVTLIVSAFLTGALTNMTIAPPHNASPLAINVPPEIWALLGLGSFTAIAAPAIKEGQRRGSPPPAVVTQDQAVLMKAVKAEQGLGSEGHFEGPVYVKDSPADARWIDLIRGDHQGFYYVDVSKLQQLVFSVILVVTYGFDIWLTMKGTGRFASFPVPPASFVALLGISHATYLADKQVNRT